MGYHTDNTPTPMELERLEEYGTHGARTIYNDELTRYDEKFLKFTERKDAHSYIVNNHIDNTDLNLR